MKLLCASLMCVSFTQLNKEIQALEEAQVDMMHCDIMDGNFVPNMAMSLSDIRAVRELTKIKIDCHLMIDNPSSKVDWFIDAGADLIYIHPESDHNVIKTLQHIKESGVECGLAISPDTSIEQVKEMLEYCDYIMIMTVHPGFASQHFLASMKTKIKSFIEEKDHYQYKIILDGACSRDVISTFSKLGCDGFVLGTSALFHKERNYKKEVEEIRKL